MKHIITLAIFAALSTAAAAKDPKPAPATGNATAVSAAQANAIAAAVALAVQKQMQAQSQSAQAISGGNSMSTTVQAQERDPVATAYSAGLAASNGTCLGSASGGVQGAAIGISLASTTKDNGCDVRYDAAALRAAGHGDAADARLCQKPEIAEAFAAAGKPCTDKRTPAMKTATSEYTGSDPFVRARLGISQ